MSLNTLQTGLLRRALTLAVSARATGNPPFGSLLIDGTGAVLAEDTNTTITDNDITAHPELKLARWAARTLIDRQLADVTMYTSCEPCPMCANAIGRAGIGRVVFALSNAQLAVLKPPLMPPPSRPFVSDGPHLHSESAQPLAGYYR
ncbi:tRNA(Arg) A34 adenosine deaminase TadA [Microbacterium sp. SORGH_AS 1204]|uniref:nucleoside deaminase n=1 Tax=Microbacterium sp. SORGH_AS_1204 TaxID=3041785 RepID=UPI00278E7357|nr:nucleoside deaminase [Microbacterium sp. SORGH_AS_1204]MDQ1135726.1 tRNA(Arg) A34 adenosine deaminase TadA [Microbacterium sp. SORGH_AS_1204]